MKILNIIECIKSYHLGVYNGQTIDSKTTRDKILYGNPDIECTGIITTCWASIKVIEEAIKKGANLIICHEALFWNHGDHKEWLIESENSTYFDKVKLLDKYNIVVWRNHDYVHSGIPLENGEYTDGIFYGLSKKLGWEKYIVDKKRNSEYLIPKTNLYDLSKYIVKRLNLNGVKVIGDKNTLIERIKIPYHIFGDANDYIKEANEGKYDCFLTLELVDFTLAEYVLDRSLISGDISIIGIGHFNLEEPGMEYMLSYLPDAIGNKNIPMFYVQSGDMYNYIIK